MHRRTKIVLIMSALFFVGSFFVGCGPKKKNQVGNNVSDPAAICNPLSYTTNTCVDTSGVTSDPFENSPKVYYFQTQPANAAFRTFLQEALGICDRQSGQLLGFDFGSHDCDSYMAGLTTFTIYLTSPNSPTANVSVASYYSQTSSVSINLSLGLTLAPWAYQNPMSLPGLAVAPIKNNQGFEIYGPATNPAFQATSLAWAKRFRIRVENGKLTDSFVTGDIYYGNDIIVENASFQLQNI